MLKKMLLSIAAALTLLLPFASATAAPADGLRGVWVPSVLNLDYPSKEGLSVSQLKSEADTILDKIQSMGMNAVFLQVRPSSDALYDSSIYPWSVYLTGTQGQAPAGNFDPLEYWVGAAHARGLQLHAWLNPYRITKKGEDEWNALSSSNPAKLHPEWVVKYDDNYYFDPGIPAVQQLVVDGAAEIARNYNVDGIHLDDYFYPGSDFDDADTFSRYGSGFSSKADWRRDNVNTLVAKLDTQLHQIDSALSFGISPIGIWDNKTSNPLGSDTAGRSSYREIYCDTLHWINTGTVDYVCPQIYWNIGYSIADFSILLDWWTNAVQGSDVALYIGIGAYRMEDANSGSVWSGTGEIDRQLDKIAAKGSRVSGFVFYRYNSFTKVPAAATYLKNRFGGIVPPVITPPNYSDTSLKNWGNRISTSLSGIYSEFLNSLY